MFKPFFKDRLLIILLISTFFIKLFSLNSASVETYYTYGIYPFIAKTLRLLTGWLPFSLGDVLYFFAFIYLVFIAVKLVLKIRRRKKNKILWWLLLRKGVVTVLLVYLFFQSLWGLNYSRLGIAHQLHLNVKRYSLTDLDTLTTVLQQRLNAAALLVDSANREKTSTNVTLLSTGVAAYKQAANQHSFLTYVYPSLKPSLYSRIGHFFGFTGYYNPFSGEAQINTTVPSFLKPFVTLHEMAHQLGYGKENEANFVAFLACRNFKNVSFRYSVYYELYLYAAREVVRRDTVLYRTFKEKLHPLVLKDNEQLMQYLMKTANPVEPYITAFYDQYLKMNSQPKGMRTYNEVVAWLIAYQKKYGIQSI